MKEWLLNHLHDYGSRIANAIKAPFRVRNAYTDPATIIRDFNRAYDLHSKRALIECSTIEDQENSHYTGILNTLSNHCVGTVPIPVCASDNDDLNDNIEDMWMDWSISNSVGSSIREMRRVAAQTGLAVAIPYRKATDAEIKLGFHIVGQQHLKTPTFALLRNPNAPKIIDGVEYLPNGDVAAVWIQEEGKLEPTRYSVPKEAYLWSRKRNLPFWPECSPAFTVYPSIRRFLENVMRGEEMKTAMPMAVELGESYKAHVGDVIPKGSFKYEPGMVVTLPPDTKLSGLNWGAMASDRGKLLDMMVSTAARCIDMPLNLARASSSDSNMATAHIDLQPWKYVVDIDRFDFETFVRWVFNYWYSIAKYSPNMNSDALLIRRPPILFNYTVLFEHPDPGKRATARSTDLVSGASTLTRIYAEQGKNARREIRKECKLLGISVEEYIKQLLASRSKQVAEVLYAATQTGAQGTQNNQQQQRSQTA